MPLRIPLTVAQPNLLGRIVSEGGSAENAFGRWCNSVYKVLSTATPTYSAAQANLPDLTGIVTPVLIYVSDYAHFLYWDGLALSFAGDPSGQLVEFLVPPAGPGWHLCDGAVDVPYLLEDGTTDVVTLPVIANTYFRQ